MSGALIDVLCGHRPARSLPAPGIADPYGDDAQLALYLAYELHYRGYCGVDPGLEWDPDLLRFRAALEHAFLAALRSGTAGGGDVGEALAALDASPAGGRGPSWHLESSGQLWQLREYVAHRSLYHLKEADPQAWLIPRLEGAAKVALVSVEHDEYGAGRPERLHSLLFADMMVALDLDPAYGAYLQVAPAPALALVNAMSVFGLHRSLRGAAVGHFASVEAGSPPGSARLARAVERLVGAPAAAFYVEHVEADAVHEQLVRVGVVGGLLSSTPELAADVVFGIQAEALLEDRFADHVMTAWEAAQTSLRKPLTAGVN